MVIEVVAVTVEEAVAPVLPSFLCIVRKVVTLRVILADCLTV